MGKAKKNSKKLMEHLKKHCLIYYEDVVPFDSIETSDYFCHKYNIADVVFEDKVYCFFLRDQLGNYTNTFTRIGGAHKWLFYESSNLFINYVFVDTKKIVSNYILKYNMTDSKAFYHRIDSFPKTIDFFRATYLNFMSNPLDEYAFLSYLHLAEDDYIGSKIDFLMYYRLLKGKGEVNNHRAR